MVLQFLRFQRCWVAYFAKLLRFGCSGLDFGGGQMGPGRVPGLDFGGQNAAILELTRGRWNGGATKSAASAKDAQACEIVTDSS